MKLKLLLVFLCMNQLMIAQRITGSVFSEKGDLVPYASVTVKGSTRGASANQKGNFSFSIPNGTYRIVCQSIGYTSDEKDVTVAGTDVEITFILKKQELTLKEVIVKSRDEDPAYEIIRQAIKKRNFYNEQVKAFSCDLYSKDIIRFKSMPDRVLGKKVKQEDKKEMGLDSAGKGVMYLSEAVSKIYKQRPDKFKMEVISSRVSGSESFGFTFPAFISMYTNNVIVFSEKLNPRGFVSPIADGALRFYKYKFLGNFWEDGHMIHSIRVTAKRDYEPLFNGVINISDEDWRIQSLDLTVTKRNQLELLDTLNIKQLHLPVNKDVWQVNSQVIFFDFNFFGIGTNGNFQTVYNNYDVDPKFSKNTFDRVIIKYDTAASKRQKSYWDSIRPVPLALEEQKDYKYKDSVYTARKDSMFTKTAMDSMRRMQAKVKPWDILFKGIHKYHFSKRRFTKYGVESLFKNMEYNTVEGVVLNLRGYYDRSLNEKTRLEIEPSFRYGFSNEHFNSFTNVIISKKHFDPKNTHYDTWFFSGGKRVSSFNGLDSYFERLRNTSSTLFNGNNFLKIYENYFGEISFKRKYESGITYSITGLFENRTPLENTTTYTFRKKDSIHLTVNYPYEKINTQFIKHQAASIALDISWTPGQKYIQFPKFKMPLGSKYPTFTFNYTKGIKDVFGSDADYDKWKFGVSDTRNLKLAGTLKYRAGIGGFLNAKNVFIQDYQHFNGNPARSAAEYVNSFQLAGYYANSTISSFYSVAHLEHHFNGLLTNKIPLFRKLNWNLLGGGNAFYINSKSNYAELFVGLENIFKVLRVDFVAGFENGRKGRTAIIIGSGGSLSPKMPSASAKRRGNTMEISF